MPRSKIRRHSTTRKTPNRSIDDAVLRLPFDSYERYTVSAEIMSLLWPRRRSPLSILDVGGHFGSLKHFRERDRVIVADMKEPPPFTYRESVPFRSDGYVQAAGGALPFPDSSFDLVAAHDTLEHVPELLREGFLDDLLRVTRRFVILHGPMDEPETARAERRLARFWREGLGWEVHPLLEHLEMGLPPRAFVERYLRERGNPFVGVPNGNIVVWLTMMTLKHYVLAYPNSRGLEETMDRTFNQLLAPQDFGGACYRWAYAIGKHSADGPGLARVRRAFATRVRSRPLVEGIEVLETLVGGLEGQARAGRDLIDQLQSTIHTLNLTIQKKDSISAAKFEAARAKFEAARAKFEAARAKFEAELMTKQNFIEQLQLGLVQRDSMIAEKDAAVRDRDSAVADKELRLEDSLARYQQIIGSIGYRFIQKLRRGVDRLAPAGSRRRGLVRMVGHGIDVLLREGFLRFFGKLLRVWRWVPRLFQRAPAGTRAPEEPLARHPLDEQYHRWLEKNALTPERIAHMRHEAASLGYRPLVSIVMPVSNTEPEWLSAAIESVLRQIYDNWELCIADDRSRRRATRKLLRRYAKRDPRINATLLGTKQGIAGASNAALGVATGEFITFLDHDDELKPEALFRVVKLLNEQRDLDYIYSDEDKRDTNGRLVDPFFKPDWSPDLLMSVNFVNHLSVFRKELVDQVGGLRSDYDGSQDYDLVLRVTEVTDRIAHIAWPLYSWRKAPGSAAAVVNAKEFAYEAGKRALLDALRRRGDEGEVVPAFVPGRYRVRYAIRGNPKVAIIIPTRDRLDMLRRCVDSIRQLSTYRNFEITIIDNRSEGPETLMYLESFPGQVIRYPYEFNYARMMNVAAREVEGDYLLFLNNDIEVISSEWIEAMLEHAQRPEVAAVGARLLYPDGRPQHEGIIIGFAGGSAGNVDFSGFHAFGETIRNCSAVTGACMMVRPEVYWELGGLEERLGVAFNDVDFCLRAREKGYQVVYTPYALLSHHESATRGRLHPEEDEQFFRARWGNPGDYKDPYFNPNLDPLRPFRLRV